MTQQEAMLEQKMIQIKGFDLGWYFGTDCEKCCGVFPRFVERNVNDKDHNCAYKCDVCGKQTEWVGMPWVAREAWNNHQFMGEGVQLSFI